jgi:CRISPR-associated protein Cmr6
VTELLIGGAAADLDPDSAGFRATANARLLLHRSAVLVTAQGESALQHTAVSAWAVATGLGQEPALLASVNARRAAALAALEQQDGVRVRTVALETRGALLVGAGTSGVRDVGIELDATYGWPILPGSSLKGIAREYALLTGLPPAEIEAIFGAEPEAEEIVPGSVAFFDALPGDGGVQVAAHVLTPHTRGYRSAADAGSGPVAPGESVNPVPIPFLAIERGRFVAHLAGPEPAVAQAVELLTKAADDLGVGAKTAAGYGYLKVVSDAGSTPASVGARRRK